MHNHNIHLLGAYSLPYQVEEMRSENDNEPQAVYRDHWSVDLLAVVAVGGGLIVYLCYGFVPTCYALANLMAWMGV